MKKSGMLSSVPDFFVKNFALSRFFLFTFAAKLSNKQEITNIYLILFN